MKATIYCIVFTFVSLWTFSLFGQGTCHKGGGYPNGNVQLYPNTQVPPYGATGTGVYNPNQVSAGYPVAAPTTPVAPSARITVVSANTTLGPQATSKTPVAKLTVVADDVPSAPKTAEVAAEKTSAIGSTIAGLVGNWKAVARKSDGELTTIQLHLDNRGWAELTVPGADGKPSTTKSRVNLENEELKLTGSDKVVSLGKLVEFNTRQMVLELAEGQVTFVRL
jgi:hypothetical protein